MDRDELRARCWKQYQQYRVGKYEVFCPICDEHITEGFDLHEWMVKRSSVPTDKQDLIMVPENCVPLHHRCHMEAGQTKDTREKCLWHVAGVLGARRVGEWYVRLWKEHGLSVPRGMLIPPEDMPPYRGRKLYDLGCKLAGEKSGKAAIPTEKDETIPLDARDIAFALWTGWLKPRSKEVKRLEASFSSSLLIERICTGYWMEYLLGVVG